MRDPQERSGTTSVLRLRGTVLCGSLWMLIAMAGDFSAPFGAEVAPPPQVASDDAAPVTLDAVATLPRRSR